MEIKAVKLGAIDKHALETVMSLESPAVHPVITINVDADAVTEAKDISPVGCIGYALSCGVAATNIRHAIRTNDDAGLNVAGRPVIHDEVINTHLAAFDLNIDKFAVGTCLEKFRWCKREPRVFLRLYPCL